jgi:hypothetical protein
LEDVPPNGVCSKEVCEELGDNAEAVRFEAVDSFVIMGEALFEKVGPHAVDLAEALTDHAVEFLVCTLLTGAFNDHSCEFVLEAVWEIDAHQLVTTFFEATARLDSEVDGSTQADEVGVGLILDVLSLLLFILLI